MQIRYPPPPSHRAEMVSYPRSLTFKLDGKCRIVRGRSVTPFTVNKVGVRFSVLNENLPVYAPSRRRTTDACWWWYHQTKKSESKHNYRYLVIATTFNVSYLNLCLELTLFFCCDTHSICSLLLPVLYCCNHSISSLYVAVAQSILYCCNHSISSLTLELFR